MHSRGAFRVWLIDTRSCAPTLRRRRVDSSRLSHPRGVSLSEPPKAEREDKLQGLLLEEARHPFDLEHGPLFRACLFRLQPDDFVLIITTHHIIADGWSQRVVQHELWSIYEALAGARPPSLAPLPIQ